MAKRKAHSREGRRERSKTPRENPWATLGLVEMPEEHKLRRELRRYLQTLERTKSVRAACLAAFGHSDKYRKNAIHLFEAAFRLGILEVNVDASDLGDRLRERFELADVKVLDLDTTEQQDCELFAREAARFFLKRLGVHVSRTPEKGNMGVAVGGGSTTALMLQGLETDPGIRLTGPGSYPWCARAMDVLHVWTPTVGYLPEDVYCSCQKQACDLVKCFDLKGGQSHVLMGPPFFKGLDDRREFEKRLGHQELERAKKSIRFVVASCGATKDNYCMRVMLQGGEFDLKNFAGEILFNFYDDCGGLVDLGVYNRTFTLFSPDRIMLPDLVSKADAKAEDFESLGIVCATKPEQRDGKAKAVLGALKNPKQRWFNTLVCTADIARAVLFSGSQDSGS